MEDARTKRPPLSPAAQAVLTAAKETPWRVLPAREQDGAALDSTLVVGEYEDEPDAMVVVDYAENTDAVAEALAHAVNHHARDRELLAMARDVIQKLADAGTVAFHYDIARLTIQNRCLICDWPLHDKAEDGCTRDNCAYRTEDNTERVQLAARRERAAVVYAIEKAQHVLAALGTEAGA